MGEDVPVVSVKDTGADAGTPNFTEAGGFEVAELEHHSNVTC